MVRWPDAHVCNACYLRAKRTRGTCRCGHVGVLPGIIKGAPACRACSGIRMNLDCRTCGREDEIYRDNQCWACVLAAHVDTLLRHPDTGTMNPELVPLADALKAVKRANSGLTWIRPPHVADALTAVAVLPTLSHKAIDTMPDSPTREHIRGLLVEHGVLPARDETRERFEQWAKVALTRVEDPAHRDVIQRYIRWNHLRRMNNVDSVWAFELVHLPHVQLAIPAGGEEACRDFWGTTLGMTELVKPPILAARGGCWFRGGGLEVHLGVEQDFAPALKAHPGILVSHLAGLAARFTAAGVDVTWDDNFPGFSRFYADDPFGNRLEFLEPLPA